MGQNDSTQHYHITNQFLAYKIACAENKNFLNVPIFHDSQFILHSTGNKEVPVRCGTVLYNIYVYRFRYRTTFFTCMYNHIRKSHCNTHNRKTQIRYKRTVSRHRYVIKPQEVVNKLPMHLCRSMVKQNKRKQCPIKLHKQITVQKAYSTKILKTMSRISLLG